MYTRDEVRNMIDNYKWMRNISCCTPREMRQTTPNNIDMIIHISQIPQRLNEYDHID
jgi:hypothetical protein